MVHHRRLNWLKTVENFWNKATQKKVPPGCWRWRFNESFPQSKIMLRGRKSRVSFFIALSLHDKTRITNSPKKTIPDHGLFSGVAIKLSGASSTDHHPPANTRSIRDTSLVVQCLRERITNGHFAYVFPFSMHAIKISLGMTKSFNAKRNLRLL